MLLLVLEQFVGQRYAFPEEFCHLLYKSYLKQGITKYSGLVGKIRTGLVALQGLDRLGRTILLTVRMNVIMQILSGPGPKGSLALRALL